MLLSSFSEVKREFGSSFVFRVLAFDTCSTQGRDRSPVPIIQLCNSLPSFALFTLVAEARSKVISCHSAVCCTTSQLRDTTQGKAEKSEVSRGEWMVWERRDKTKVIVQAESNEGIGCGC